MQTALIIFARFDSTRLPGKVLMPLHGRPLLGLVLDRARLVRGHHMIIIATSERPVDDPINDFAKSENVQIFRGSLDDVAGRALACCESFGIDRFARICADRPFLPWGLLDQLMTKQESEQLDLATNALVRTYPSGTMTEVITRKAMALVCEQTDDADELEHVTKYIYTNPDTFRIGSIEAEDHQWADINLSLDTPRDKERTEWILDKLGPEPERAELMAVMDLSKQWELEN